MSSAVEKPLSLFLVTLGLLALAPQLPAAADSSAGRKRAEMFYGVAEGNYLSGNSGGAETALRQALNSDPGHRLSARLLARIQLENGEPQAALETVGQASRNTPGDPDLLLLRAVAFGTLARLEEADADLQTVLANTAPQDPARIEAKRVEAVLDATGGDWNEAALAFLATRNRRHSDPSTIKLAAAAWMQRARKAGERGDFESALEFLDQALEHVPVSASDARARLQILRGQTRARAGDVDAAVADLREVVLRDPGDLEARLVLAALYASSGRWQALDELMEPVAADPRLADIALYLEGRSAFARGRIGTAREKFESALDALSPQAASLRPVLLFYRGWSLVELGRPAEGDEEVLAALDLGYRPDTEEEVLVIGNSLLRSGRVGEVVVHAGRLALGDSENPELWTLLGRAHEAEDLRALALSAYSRALECDAGHVPARVRRARLLRAVGDLEGAAIDYGRALEATDDPALRYALGLVLLQQGAVTAAERNLGRAAAALPSNAAVQLLHALCADAAGDPDGASRSLARYREAVPERPSEAALLLGFHLSAPEDRARALRTLRAALEARPVHAHNDLYQLLADYYAGDADREALLNAAGYAVSERDARRRICEISYWMARDRGERELLEIAAGTGESDLTEYQLARWKLAALEQAE